MIFAGCDLGIVSAQAAIIDNHHIRALETVPYNNLPKVAAKDVMDTALYKAGLTYDDIDYCMATGFGRRAVPFADDVVHDAGSLHRAVQEINASIKTVIDVGGHTLQAFGINDKGAITENISLQRCVTGTGLFLDVIARVLETPIEELLRAALESKNPATVTSQCVVLAESEVISLVNEGRNKEDIFAGVVHFTAIRIASSIRKLKIRKDVAFVGGMAKNPIVSGHLEKGLDIKFDSLNGMDPQSVSAYGAALIARDRVNTHFSSLVSG